MTYRELNSYRHLISEIKELESELAQISYLRVQNYSGMPGKRADVSTVESIAEKCDKINSRIESRKRMAAEALDSIDEYISLIPDSGVRAVFHARFISGLSYEQIGYKMNMDRRTVSRTIHKYIETNL